MPIIGPVAIDTAKEMISPAKKRKNQTRHQWPFTSRLLFFSPFATLRTLSSAPYEGEKYAAIFAEHDFRTVLFELLGWDYMTKNGIGIIIHAAAGRTWISKQRLEELPFQVHTSDHLHQEIGLSINGLFKLFRVDISQRLDRAATFIGFGFSRFF